ncbi:MAG: amidohydrolase family protein [Okeania sp. SIO2C2]|uniref:amidohydrolase n=1 Tax=Okeania sp. SIO2C2 TaxID=2607787 RepID=UPI0013B9DB1C|nr:amidohydrolase family protein [Okeania sp. SIO2C2]NEP87644.1 amidohydrolase family protein [Okeania sp. SIO2C2]
MCKEKIPYEENIDPKDYRPIVIWHRSCHEFIFNTAALDKYGIDKTLLQDLDELTKSQADVENGHFFEKGLEVILGKIAGDFLSEDRINNGVDMLRKYLISKGVTTICEPGTQMNKDIQDVWNTVLNDPNAAFRTYFIPDGRVLYDTHKKNNNLGMLIQNTKSWLNQGEGKVDWLPQQIKLFADGAIFSQLMQLQDPYLDGHQGEWIAEPEDYKAAFKLYWEAGYQINTHVNGDEGLRVVVETLAENMKRFPRKDHRFTVVHFAVSTEEQVKALGELGAIVTANPYYVNALADKYSESGLGPSRADNMVRLGSVASKGMILSLHSDMPMAPADPLFLAWCAAERLNVTEDRVAAPNQCISIERSLSAVTIESAYCLGLENEIGSIKPQKKANFAILEHDPMDVKRFDDEPTDTRPILKDIGIWGCVFEGKKFPVEPEEESASEILPVEINLEETKVNLVGLASTRG